MLSRKRNQSGAAPRKCDERMHFNACPCSSLGCWRAVKCKPSPLCELDIPADPPRRLMRHNTTKPRSIGIVTSLCYHPRYARAEYVASHTEFSWFVIQFKLLTMLLRSLLIVRT